MIMKSCCFTGHRKVKITDELKAGLRRVLTGLIKTGVTEFYAGGAIGWDMLCEKTVLELKQEYCGIHLHIIMPCSLDEQTQKWDSQQITEYKGIIERADSVEIVSESYSKDCMKKRNARLVELSDVCVCYYKNKRSGTGQTVRMAEKKGIEVINLYQNA